MDVLSQQTAATATTATAPEAAGQTFTSTTAPGKIFTSRQELAQHYKTSYHKYNLKRREAGLVPISETDFNARFAAAQAVLLQQQAQQNSKASRKQQQQQTASTSGNEVSATEGDGNDVEDSLQQKLQLQEQQKSKKNVVEINPKQCLFDRHISSSVTKNIQRMHRKYGFFIPDSEYMIDPTGFIGYCHETIQIGNVCLYCYKQFRTATSCIQHMRNKYHTKIRYEIGYDLEYLDVFYNFVDVNNEFLRSNNLQHKKNVQKIKQSVEPTTGSTTNNDVQQDSNQEDEPVMNDTVKDDIVNDKNEEESDSKVDDEKEQDVDEDEEANDDDGEEEEWEDVSDDEIEDDDDIDDDDDEDMYTGYEEEVNKMGWKITPLGELIFPDGRIIGHRGLRKYYKQQSFHKMKYEAQYNQNTSVAVIAARQASQERLYRGHVYNIGGSNSTVLALPSSENCHALALAGIAPGTVRGRAGNGLLVMNKGPNNNHTYSQVSIYRYRAAVRKQRIQQRQGQQIQLRTTTNMNKMNKKHNRLMNNVSVAHAQR